jgi:hypothetical protein
VARHPLAIAFVLSLAVHLTLFGGWRLGKRLGWWEHQATWLLDLRKKLHPKALQPTLAQARTPSPAPPREIPLTFVEVDPTVASTESPKEAKYYSARPSKAANPDPTLDTMVPKVEGQQTKLVRVEDVPKPSPQPLQPAAPPEKAPEQAEAKAKPAENPGDLAKAKPEQIKKPNDGLAELGVAPTPVAPRPRTLAAARQNKPSLVGQKMKQEGSVRERGKLALDVKATPFGSYDAALIAAVQQRWYDLLESTLFAQHSGKVILEFRLYYDGRITDMKVDGNEVGEILGSICQRAVLDPSPFAQWPSDMRRAIGKNYREVLFTFYYN